MLIKTTVKCNNCGRNFETPLQFSRYRCDNCSKESILCPKCGNKGLKCSRCGGEIITNDEHIARHGIEDIYGNIIKVNGPIMH